MDTSRMEEVQSGQFYQVHSWSPQGMHHIGCSKIFSITDKLIFQGSKTKIGLCKWEKML